MKKIFVSIILLTALISSSCRNDSDKFLGTWHSNIVTGPDSVAYTFTITKNGKNFIMNYMSLEYPMSYDKNSDMMIAEESKGKSAMIIDLKCNCLITDGLKYARETSNKGK